MHLRLHDRVVDRDRLAVRSGEGVVALSEQECARDVPARSGEISELGVALLEGMLLDNPTEALRRAQWVWRPPADAPVPSAMDRTLARTLEAMVRPVRTGDRPVAADGA
jgi:hypothetical protein